MIPISDFITKLTDQGIASPSRYWAEFSMPDGIGGINFGALNQQSMSGDIASVNTQLNSGPDLSMKCVSMQFPSRSLMTNENRHYGTPYKLPYAAVYDELSFTFIASSDLRERQFFEIWQEAIVNVSTNSLNFYNEYIAQCKLYQLDKQNNITYGVTLFDAYPINIGAVDYSYSTTNETVTVPITLSYRRWKNILFK